MAGKIMQFSYTRFCAAFGMLRVASGHPSLLTMRHEQRGCFHSDCCTGESMSTLRVNRFFALTHQRRTRGWVGRPGIQRSLPDLVAHAQPTAPFSRLKSRISRLFINIHRNQKQHLAFVSLTELQNPPFHQSVAYQSDMPAWITPVQI